MKIIVIGASGHVGSAVVGAFQGRHEVVTASRSTEPPLDVTDPESMAGFFTAIGQVDAIVSCVGSVPFKPLGELGRDDYVAAFTGKVLSQLDLVRLGTPYLRDGGSITLTTGILAREPILTGAAAAMANGAVESFVISAATELPRGIRLNTVSPTVLLEATGYHSSFPGFVPVAGAIVAQSYAKSVEGTQTGRIFRID
ncbi:short chain dehydrogenase [Cryobacterium sp. Y82]|uniref:short chain dehydrogenase n=1 Tax=Cryobacterium sp. Y82 TaxID=2045017 RepID=UPI000CE42472|nr:short chain dehydrogenase [Cryobacterium sp. Y82]